VPGRAAYMDGRGASSMRLNFAGIREEDIREGIRRIGKVVGEQVGLFGTLTESPPPPASPPSATSSASGAPPASPPAAVPPAEHPSKPKPLADVVELPQRRRARGR